MEYMRQAEKIAKLRVTIFGEFALVAAFLIVLGLSGFSLESQAEVLGFGWFASMVIAVG